MKKILTILTVIAFSTVLVVDAAESRLQNYVNQKISPLTQKEQEINSKIEAQKKADAAKKAEMQKKQAEQKAAIEKAKKDAEARQQARKNAFEAEKNYWKSLGK